MPKAVTALSTAVTSMRFKDCTFIPDMAVPSGTQSDF